MNVKKGDLLLYKGSQWFSFVIRHVIKSPYTHSLFVDRTDLDGNVWVYNCNKSDGLKYYKFKPRDLKKYLILRLKDSTISFNNSIALLNILVRRKYKYNTLHLFSLLFYHWNLISNTTVKHISERNRRIICSNLMDLVYFYSTKLDGSINQAYIDASYKVGLFGNWHLANPKHFFDMECFDHIELAE